MLKKITLLIVLLLTVVSCLPDRNEEMTPNYKEKSTIQNKQKKINNLRDDSSQLKAVGDSIIIKSPDSGNSIEIDESEIIPPGDVKPPKGGK